jgi:hypothetical protein
MSLTQDDLLMASVAVMDALGICEADFANWYLSQIIDVARPGARPGRGGPLRVGIRGSHLQTLPSLGLHRDDVRSGIKRGLGLGEQSPAVLVLSP